MTELIITIGDLRKEGHCCNGQRRFFTAHGLDFNDFVKHGIPAERLLATQDQRAVKAVEKARERLKNG